MKFSSSGSLLANPLFASIAIVVTTLVIYSNVYDAPFVFDDQYQIEDNMKIRDLQNYSTPKGFLSRRPLTSFSFAINYRIGKLKPFGYHLVNISIHILNGLLVYVLSFWVLKRLSLNKYQYPKEAGIVEETLTSRRKQVLDTPVFMQMMSLFAALFFVAHPIQTQSVTYIVQRYTSMSASFYLGAVLFYIWARSLQVNRAPKSSSQAVLPEFVRCRNGMFGFKVFTCFFLFVFLGVLALLCKENAATLFGVTLLVEYFLFDRTWAGWRKKLIWLVPITCILVALVLYFFASIRGIRFENLLEDVSILTRESRTIDRFSYLCTQFSVFVQYVRLLFFPLGQNLDYMMPFKRGFFDGYTPLAFLFVVFVLVLGFWNIRKRPAVSFGIFWFFVTLSIESSIFPISDAIFEHRLYLPMFGFAVAVVYSVFDLFQDREKWAVVILSVAFLGLSTGTYLRNQIWKDPVMLWADVTSKSPHNHRAYYNLGNVLQRRGKLDEALLQYEKALQLRPNFAVAHDNMGLVFMAKGNIPEAVKHTGMAVRIRPGNAIIQNNYGQILLRQGRIEEAARHFYQAVRIKPRYAKAQNNLGIALAQQKKLIEAKEHLLLATRLDPSNPEILNNVGQVFMLQGNSKEAVRYFEAAIQQNPNFAQALANLGFMRLKENRVDEAAQYFNRALAVAPDMGRARQGLNLAIKAKGNWGPRR